MRADYDDAQGDGHWRTYLEMLFPRWAHFPVYGFDDLREVDTPTLVLSGDRDMFCSVEDAVRTYRTLPNGELAVLPGADHSISALKVSTTIDFLLRHA
jgi:pimeloyl-ACP methyl ester carboxylesterase